MRYLFFIVFLLSWSDCILSFDGEVEIDADRVVYDGDEVRLLGGVYFDYKDMYVVSDRAFMYGDDDKVSHLCYFDLFDNVHANIFGDNDFTCGEALVDIVGNKVKFKGKIV